MLNRQISILIAPDAPVCQACRRDIGRVGSDPDFTPRWEKVKGKRGECVIHECTAEVFASSKPISMETFQSALAATRLNAVNNPIPLCKHLLYHPGHYFMLYHTTLHQRKSQ